MKSHTESESGLFKDQSNDLLQRMSINQLATIRWSLIEDLDAFQEWNVPAIGLSWRKLLEFGVQRGIHAVRTSGMKVSNISWVGGVTGQYGYSFEEVMLDAKRAVRVAAQLRAPTVSFITGPQNGHIDSHARRLVFDALLELGELAETCNVNIALRPMHPIYRQSWTFMHELDDAIKLIDMVAHPHVKLDFGTFHLASETELSLRIPEIIDYIGVIHLADRMQYPHNENDLQLPGDGELPIADVVSALESANYDGWYNTEVWSTDLWKLDHHDLIGRCLKSHESLFSKIEIDDLHSNV